MKTNVAIELSDNQRNKLAVLLDGKQTKRKATRAEVVALCRCFVEELVGKSDGLSERKPAITKAEDRDVLAGRHPDYIRGWNKVKNRMEGRV